MRRSWINQPAFLESFLGLLDRELGALRELERLQAEALACLNQGAFSGLMDLVRKQEAVQTLIASTREELSPAMKVFTAMPEAQREATRAQGVGERLTQIEAVAHAIQGRHQGAFPESESPPANRDEPASAHASTTEAVDADLQARLARFRHSS